MHALVDAQSSGPAEQIDGSVARVHGMCVHPDGKSPSRTRPMIIVGQVQ
jgi:hypothetical protein